MIYRSRGCACRRQFLTKPPEIPLLVTPISDVCIFLRTPGVIEKDENKVKEVCMPKYRSNVLEMGKQI